MRLLTLDTTAPEVKVNGTLLSALMLGSLTGVRVSLGLRLPARAELHFLDDGYTVAASTLFAVGAKVSIALGAGKDSVFEGEVTGVSLRLHRGVPVYSVTADDLAYKLGLGTQKLTFTQMTYSDIVTQLAQSAGLRARVTATTEQFDYVIQTDTNLGFLSEMADRIGYDWWVDGSTLHFEPPENETRSTATLTFGEELLQFDVRATALHPSRATVTGWSAQSKAQVQGIGPTDGVKNLPTASLVTPFVTATTLSSVAQATISAESPVSSAEAKGLAERAVSQWLTGAVTARGTAYVNDSIKLRSGVTILGAGPAAGTYVVTEVEHSYTAGGGFQTRFTAGERRPRSLVDRLSPRAPGSFRRDGLIVGVVTKIGNVNGSPGDVQVLYPGVDDQLSSNWARVAIQGGGKGRGITFMPEVNDEVIVGFENGDLRRPVILGGMFNGKDSQPAFRNVNSQVGTRQLTSRLGHTVEFGDGTADADQYIGLALAGGHHIVKLGKDALNAEVPAGTPITIKSGTASIQIDAQGQITIAGKKITLKADTDVELSGLNITAKANVKASLGGATVELKGQGMVDISASGPVKAAGNPVMIN